MLVVSDDPQRFAPGSVIVVADSQQPLTVRAVRHRADRTVVSFDEIRDRTGAEALRGSELVVPTEEARELEQDEYWDHDLIGCSVVTSESEQIGVVTDVLHQPANEVLVVAGPEKEVLIPLVAAVVKRVEPGRLITIDPPPGLLADE